MEPLVWVAVLAALLAILTLQWWSAGAVAKRGGGAFAIGAIFWWVATTIFGLVVWLVMVVVRKRQLRQAADE